jgi:hypothetical protein
MVTILNEGGELEEYEIPGPRFVSLDHACWTADHQREFMVHRKKGSQIYLELTTRPSQVLEMHTELQKAVERGLYVAVDVLPDCEEVTREAREAAVATKNTETLLEALTMYIDKKTLGTGISRKTVLATAKNYLDI